MYSLAPFRKKFTTGRRLKLLFVLIQLIGSTRPKFNVWPNRRSSLYLRRLNTVLAVCEYMSFAKSWQEKDCSSQAETWQVKNILMKDFDWQVKLDVFAVSMATWMIEYNLKISLFFSLHKIRSLDFPINLQTAYYN